MEASDGNEGILSKSPQNFSQDLHEVMAGALASSSVQNFKISLGNSSGKLQRPLRRAGDINLSTAISSPAVAKIDTVNAKPNPEADEDGNKEYPGKWQSLDEEYRSPVFNEDVAGLSANAFAQKQMEASAKIFRATHYLVSGFLRENPMEGAEHAYRFCKEQGLDIPRTKIKEVISTTEPFRVATSLTVSFAFPIGEMGVTTSGEASQDSNPPTYILPLTARYIWEKKVGRDSVQCQFFGQAIQIMSKSPQILAPDLHSMMAGALAASAGQNFKICLGSSSGKRKDHHRSCRGLDILAH